ncbi:MAG: NUDIX hydrolase [Candidatus Atribacteria bacterium]|nr:NUDIX hydrolase [Candidatus Atribacteria bacterium]
MNDLSEKTIRSEKIYKGRVIQLRKDEVTLPNGRKSTREIIEHPGAVVILAQNNQKKLLMVRQFRKAVEDTLIELPAGTLEPPEQVLDCARRELEEETGYQAKSWKKIFNFYSAPGFCNENLTLYFAQELNQTKTNTDQDEFIEVLELNKEEILLLLQQDKIRDAKTLIGILWWLSQ